MENNTTKKKAFGSKKSKWSVLPIVLSGVIAGGAVAGSITSIWHISKNYTESADFTKSASARIKVDPLAGYSDDEKKQPREILDSEVNETLKDCADKLSRWLKDQGQKTYDVSYELYVDKEEESDINHRYDAYLNANFEIDKVQGKGMHEDEKIDDDPYLTFFADNGFNSNEKTLVYRWYINDAHEGDKPFYSVISFRDLFSIPKKANSGDKTTSQIIVDEDGQNGVLYKVDDARSASINSVTISDIYKNLLAAKKDSEIQEEDQKPDAIKNAWGQPRLYIVNNIQGMFNEANYHLSNHWLNQDETEYVNIYQSSTYANFSSDYREKTWNNGARRTEEPNTYNRVYRLLPADKYTGTKERLPENQLQNVDVFNYFDQNTAGTFEPNASFATKYIPEIITYDEIDKFMPKQITDDYKNDTESENPKISYFWYPQATKSEAEVFLNRQINYGFGKASFVAIDFSDVNKDGNDGASIVFNRIKNEQFKYTPIQPSFNQTIFGGNNVVGILSLGFILFLIALLIILAVLYRTTGIMSWICMLFALSMTLLISTISSMAITMSLLVGMFTMSLVGFMACLAICSRMKRRLNSDEDTQLIVKRTFIKSLLPVVDISVITLLFGVCFTYIAPISFNSFGVILITGSFATFISIYLLNAALHGLFFNNSYLVNKFAFFGKPTNKANELLMPSNNLVPNTLDATKLEFPYYSQMSNKKIDTTNKRALIAVAVVGGLVLVSIILFTTIGYVSASMFKTQSIIAIAFDGDIFAQPWFKDLSYISYRFDSLSKIWYFNTNANNALDIAQNFAAASGLQLGQQIWVQNLFGSTNQDILNLALVCIIVGTLTSGLYGAIRFNWLSFVPMIAGSFCMPLIMLGLSAAFQIKFDQFVILGFALVAVVNSIFCSNILASISETWSRKDAYTKSEFKFIVNASLTNGWENILCLAIAYALFIIIFGITAPASTSTVFMVGLFIISAIITLTLSPFTLAFLTYQFMKIRNVVLLKLLEKSKSKVITDYDKVDEQGIEGINKFTKRIPVVEEPQAKGTN